MKTNDFVVPAILILVNGIIFYLIWKDHSESPNDPETIFNQLFNWFKE